MATNNELTSNNKYILNKVRACALSFMDIENPNKLSKNDITSITNNFLDWIKDHPEERNKFNIKCGYIFSNNGNSDKLFSLIKKLNNKKGGYKQRVGSRAQVMHGTARQTGGGLKRSDLKYNKHGRIVSKKLSALGKKNIKFLERAGYKAQKGKFGV